MLTFVREDTPTIMDGMVVHYRLDAHGYDGEISASRNGVCVAGLFPVLSKANCKAFAEQLERALVHHRHLAEEYVRETLTEAEVDASLAIGAGKPESQPAR